MLVERELGVLSPPGGTEYLFRDAEISVILDCITIATVLIAQKKPYTKEPHLWIKFVERVFEEENLHYRIDEQGIVHPRIDQAFDRERTAIIAVLEAAEFSAAKQSIQEAFNSIKVTGEGSLDAVRKAFDAIENVFKHFYGVSGLASNDVIRKLTPRVESAYEGRSLDSAKRMLKGFAEFVNAAHGFRHADNQKEPTPPPLDFAVLFLSQSVSYLRWLIEVSQKESDC
ncbi:hypothetical protein D1227_06845 [Henriciella mobilis]|nr:hypothetical protein D1231_05445 [Henriciella mobilis]RIJ22675.1 hypothetical protein D1227_06845 [Henriciella mobilis]